MCRASRPSDSERIQRRRMTRCGSAKAVNEATRRGRRSTCRMSALLLESSPELWDAGRQHVLQELAAATDRRRFEPEPDERPPEPFLLLVAKFFLRMLEQPADDVPVRGPRAIELPV